MAARFTGLAEDDGEHSADTFRRLQSFWGVGPGRRRRLYSEKRTATAARSNASSSRSSQHLRRVGTARLDGGKLCLQCQRPYTGFGTTCSDCRKCPNKGTAKLCPQCQQFYSGFASVCEDCQRIVGDDGESETLEHSTDDESDREVRSASNDDCGEDISQAPDVLSRSKATARVRASQRALPLLLGVCSSDLQVVLEILSKSPCIGPKGCGINQTNHEGVTPLLCASVMGNSEFVDMLIRHKADLDAADQYGVTPLHSAAYDSNAGIVRALLSAAAAVDTPDREGCTPLHMAAASPQPLGQADVVAALLHAKADPAAVALDGSTPLGLIAPCGHESAAQLLRAAFSTGFQGRRRAGR